MTPGEASGDFIGSRQPPRPSRAPLFAGRRPGRLVVVTAAALVVGLALSGKHVLSRIMADHHGGVLTMVGSEVEFYDGAPVTDVTLHWGQEFSRLAAVTNDGLVGFRRAGGVHGGEIVPDLATSMPTITDDGLTYTFQLRKGVRYSTGAPVLAGDIRRGIERTVAHPYTTTPYYTKAIVGAQACADVAESAFGQTPDCHLRAGITANDGTGTITFHLTNPTPDFVYQLALPGASAVPQDTPQDLRTGGILPATGPYMIRSYTPARDTEHGNARFLLVRNPHFHVWSSAAQPDGYPDRIVLETGYTNKEVVKRLSDGRADIAWSGAPQTDEDRLRTKHGSKLLLTTSGLNTHFVYLNATKAPFDNLDARRAVAYALDREALTSHRDLFAGPITCQLIPPGLGAYQPYCPYTRGRAKDGKWTGADATFGRALVAKSGTAGASVVFVIDDTYPAAETESRRIVAVLNGLGYHASLHVVTIDEFYDITGKPEEEWNASVGGWVPDYPAASQFLVNLASCDPDLRPTNPNNNSQYCSPALDKRMAAAWALQFTDPVKATQMWARIDREVVDAAAIIPFGNNLRRDLVNPRVGNTLVHRFTGPLIAQMWVQ